ncbi:MAG: MBL fold metallo-hydrolase, partial [Gammaproteobacteria bacterium]
MPVAKGIAVPHRARARMLSTALRRHALALLLSVFAGLGACSSGEESSDPVAPGSELGGNEETEGVANRGADTERWWDALPRPEWAAFERLDDGEGWFEVYEVQPGVLAIYESGQFEEVVSYLILGEERALLFDTGLGIGDIRGVVDGMTDKPVVVLNSHSHYDHIGGNHQFEFIYGPDHPYTRERTKGLDHDAVKEAVSPAWVWKPLPVGFDPAEYANPGYEINEFVTEGSLIELGARTLEVLMTPGHAPDSLCLLDRDRRLLFTGDTFYPAPLYTHIPGASFADYRASAHRLAAMAPLVTHLLPGHNQGLLGSEYLIRMAEAFD